MKSFLKKLLQFKLKILAQMILKKYQPEIIGITGSLGKTSTKEAVFTVLSKNDISCRRNFKNYNNEIGLPLTIIDSETGGKSLLKWLIVFLKATKLILFKDKNYPKVLILEMAADRPGDMNYLVKLAPPKIGMITSVAPVHTEFFKTLEKVAKEKSKVVSCLKEDGWAVLNADDKLVNQMREKTKAKIITYGFSDLANVKTSEESISYQGQNEGDIVEGLSFKISYQGNTILVLLAKVLGPQQVYNVLPAIAVGIIYKLSLSEIAGALKDFKPPKGRMNLIKGIKQTLIIDDSYNSSPLAAQVAVKVLGEIGMKGKGNRYAVLGDMLELGDLTVSAHQELGQAIVDNKIDYLITVGERARDIARGAITKGMNKDRVFEFKDSLSAGRFLQNRIKEKDLILVKGSQGVRMEKVVKEIMAEPLKAKELLVRQEVSWT